MDLPIEMMTDQELGKELERCAAKLRRIAGLPNPSRELQASADAARQRWNDINAVMLERAKQA